jgi:WD repeat-containing protein 11
MSWVRNSNGVYVLAALHQPYSLIIWDTANKTKLWKKTYTENLLSFSIDPFNHSRLACKNFISSTSTNNIKNVLLVLCQECILFVDDFSVAKAPSSNGRKFYISQGISSHASGGQSSNEKKSGGEGLRKMVKDLVIGEVKPK